MQHNGRKIDMLRYERKQTATSQELARPAGVSARLAALLYARGATDEAAMDAFLNPNIGQLHDPMLLKDMDRAIARIRRAIDNGERICIYGDYDADGVCATAMLHSYLSRAGAHVFYHIPSRHDDGYGMNGEAVRMLAAEGTKLIITVDNGVKAHAEIALCNELGVDVVITDHHNCDIVLPEAVAVICHTRVDDIYPNKNLCGAATALKVIHALGGMAAMTPYIPLAGLATVADVMPLLGENRALVALALKMINSNECPVGLHALANAASEKRNVYTERDMAFAFAPRLNAAGRLTEASQCVELLCCDDAQKACGMAGVLSELNARRKQEESAICEAVCAQLEGSDLTFAHSIVLKNTQWNPGVVGISAARIAERYYRPTLLLCESGGILTGSARSVRGVDIYAALKACEDCFIRFGGHSYAAGVTMEASRFDEFTQRFEETLCQMYSDDVLLPRRSYETDAEISELSLSLAEELERLAPFGEGNPQPVLRTKGVLFNQLRRIGTDGAHIKATALKQNSYQEAVGFYMGDSFERILDMERCDILYMPAVNEYHGMRTLQLQLKEIMPCAIKDAQSYAAQRRNKFFDAFSRNLLYNDMRLDVAVNRVDASACVKALLSGAVAGTLVLCFTEDGMRELLELLRDEELDAAVSVRFFANTKGPAAYNEVVAAPVMDQLELTRFRSVLVYDTPVTAGILNTLGRLAPQAELYAPRQAASAVALMAGLSMDRERFASFYRAMREHPAHYNSGEAVDCLNRCTGRPEYECRLALCIMQELGFVECGAGVAFKNDAQTKQLADSATYRALNGLAEQNKRLFFADAL